MTLSEAAAVVGTAAGAWGWTATGAGVGAAELRSPPLTERVLLRLSAFAALSAEEAAAVRALPVNARGAPAGAELIAEGAAVVAGPRIAVDGFLVSGWACRARNLADGRRQIIGFVLPGDALVSPLQPEREPALCTTVALTRVQLADAAPLRAMLGRTAEPGRCQGLRDACIAAERAEERLLLERIVSLGRRTAYERLRALLAELHQRLAVVGLTKDRGFAMPLSQEVLADALGLSTVHVNRTLQQVRRDRLAEVRGGWVTLLQPGAPGEASDATRAAPPGAAALAAMRPAATPRLGQAAPCGLVTGIPVGDHR